MDNRNATHVKRDTNDRIHTLLLRTNGAEAEFLCECGNPACVSLVTVGLNEYAARDGVPLLAHPSQPMPRTGPQAAGERDGRDGYDDAVLACRTLLTQARAAGDGQRMDDLAAILISLDQAHSEADGRRDIANPS